MTNFFKKLPTITYDGKLSKNLLARAKLTEETKNNKTLFYPYTMNENDRIDVLSYKYYDNPDYAWLIYFANDVIDPYYDLYIKEEDLLSMIKKKYGSLENAKKKIAFYRNNWYKDDGQLTPIQYESLSSKFKKYYNPLIDQYNVVYAYERKKEDWIVNTNKVLSITISSNTNFTYDEIVQQKYSNGYITANGTVVFSNNTNLILQHIEGNFISSNSTVSLTIYGSNTNSNTISVTTLSENIRDDEYNYWESVSFYDYEYELNENKKHINLIDNRYKVEAENQLKKEMSK